MDKIRLEDDMVRKKEIQKIKTLSSDVKIIDEGINIKSDNTVGIDAGAETVHAYILNKSHKQSGTNEQLQSINEKAERGVDEKGIKYTENQPPKMQNGSASQFGTRQLPDKKNGDNIPKFESSKVGVYYLDYDIQLAEINDDRIKSEEDIIINKELMEHRRQEAIVRVETIHSGGFPKNNVYDNGFTRINRQIRDSHKKRFTHNRKLFESWNEEIESNVDEKINLVHGRELKKKNKKTDIKSKDSAIVGGLAKAARNEIKWKSFDLMTKGYDVKAASQNIKTSESVKKDFQNISTVGYVVTRGAKKGVKFIFSTIKTAIKAVTNPIFPIVALAGMVLIIVVFLLVIAGGISSDGDGAGKISYIAENYQQNMDNSLMAALKKAGYDTTENANDEIRVIGDAADPEKSVALYYALVLNRGEEEVDINSIYWSSMSISATCTSGIIYNSGRYDAYDADGNVVELLVSTEVKDASGKTSKVNVQKDGDDSKDADVHAPIECKTWFVNVKALDEKEFLEKWNLSEDELEYYEFYCSEEGRKLIYGSDVDLEELLPVAENKNIMLELAAEELENQEKDDSIKNGDKYKSWFGYTVDVEWDMIFLTYLAAQAGLVDEYYVNNLDKVDSGVLQDAGELPFTSSCEWAEKWFKAKGLWMSGTYAPQPGDYVFFDEDADGTVDSVGLVAGMDEQGNIEVYRAFSSAGILKESYKPDAEMIFGYGIYVASVEVK